MSDLFLTHFDPEAEIIVATDASSYGVSAALLHKDKLGVIKAVAHASRALIAAEKIIVR